MTIRVNVVMMKEEGKDQPPHVPLKLPIPISFTQIGLCLKKSIGQHLSKLLHSRCYRRSFKDCLIDA